MIVFDLRCDHAHVFEAWFGSSVDYDAQRAKGLLACPVCDSREIDKAVMAPAVGPKGNQAPVTQPAAASAHTMPEMKKMLAAMAEMQHHIEANSDYVGDRFADEARAIHLGESDQRGIYGEATVADAIALREEGIDVAPLPFRPRRASDA